MIHSESLTLQWLNAQAKQMQSQADLLERMVHALKLVEELSRAGLEFTFKGGTSLALHFADLQRLSIDVDIEVRSELGYQSVEEALGRIVTVDSVFVGWEEESRPGSTEHSRHFRVRYSPIRKGSGAISHVLLDVIFISSLNPFRVPVDVTNQILSVTTPYTQVYVPSIEALLGEKLTAIATLTTGVPLSKELDMVKQVFDVHRLMPVAQDPMDVLTAFERTLEVQRECFNQNYNKNEVIADICQLALAHYHDNNAVYHLTLKTATQSGVKSFRAYTARGVVFREERFRLTLLKAALYLTATVNGRQYIPYDRTIHVAPPTLPDEYQGIKRLPKTERAEAAYYVHEILGNTSL
ncbi:MAG: nucleotidyl transferase AbiEii/AbiGii toxin family protein [Ignavibacteria bacterium]|nr:nucleotidyl transferase AbiEii/AbiGii toxin family protein [Ignavibacteria bacterium]